MLKPPQPKIIILLLGLALAATLVIFYAVSPPPKIGPDPYNLSAPEKEAFYKIAAENAVPSDFIDLGGCDPKPSALKVTQNKTFTVRNNDAAFHILVIDPGREYLIPAGGVKEITADFGKGPGIYGFGCDESEEAVGVILITE